MSEGSIRDFESRKRVPHPAKLIAIRRALEAGGVRFISDGQQTVGGPGLRMKRATALSRRPLQDGEAGIITNSEM